MRLRRTSLAHRGHCQHPRRQEATDYDAVAGIIQPMLMISGDDAKTWSEPLLVVPRNFAASGEEEFALAELDNGDCLACSARSISDGARVEVHWQGSSRRRAELEAVDFRPALSARRATVLLHAGRGDPASPPAASTGRPTPGSPLGGLGPGDRQQLAAAAVQSADGDPA